jgi:23S rRNA-/tRNA-specific pseudouridylate synthase
MDALVSLQLQQQQFQQQLLERNLQGQTQMQTQTDMNLNMSLAAQQQFTNQYPNQIQYMPMPTPGYLYLPPGQPQVPQQQMPLPDETQSIVHPSEDLGVIEQKPEVLPAPRPQNTQQMQPSESEGEKKDNIEEPNTGT